jgi:hypothetical protein
MKLPAHRPASDTFAFGPAPAAGAAAPGAGAVAGAAGAASGRPDTPTYDRTAAASTVPEAPAAAPPKKKQQLSLFDKLERFVKIKGLFLQCHANPQYKEDNKEEDRRLLPTRFLIPVMAMFLGLSPRDVAKAVL